MIKQLLSQYYTIYILGSLLNYTYLCGMKLKSTTERVEETVDPSTGEIINHVVTTSKTFTAKLTSEQFYLTFINAVDLVLDNFTKTDRRVLDKLCKLSEYDTGMVMLPAFRKKEICDDLNIKRQSLYNSLQSLKNKSAITMMDGMVKINPLYFWKGTLKTRASLLENNEVFISFGIVDANGKIPNND